MTGFIYVITNGRDQFKVGYSKNPAARLGALQTANSDRLALVGTMPGTLADEWALHQHMAAHRLAGEWFVANQILSGLIAQLEAPAAPAPLTVVDTVISCLGGTAKAAGSLGLSGQNVVANWRLRNSIPAQYVVAIEKLTQIPASAIRPDIFGEAA